MTRWQIAAVLAVVVATIAALGVAGSRVLERDRREIQAEFAEARLQRLDAAAQELGHDFEKIAEDLALALVLAGSAEPAVLERELAAVATITREYLGWEVRGPDDALVLHVEAPDAPAGVMDRMAPAIAETMMASRRSPGEVETSRASVVDPGVRVLARTGRAGDRELTVAVLVDTKPILAKLRLLREADSALLILGAHGAPAASSDEAAAAAVRALPDGDLPRFGALVAAMRARERVVMTLDEREAAALGLPRAAAVAVAVPARVEDADPWSLALIASTAALGSQERTLVRRMFAGVGFLGAILIVVAAYIVYSARRSATMRERLRQADRLAHLTEKAEKILDHIPSGVLALSGDGRVTAINAWLRARAGDVVGRDLRSAFPDAPAAEVDRLAALVDEAGRAGAVRSLHGESLSLFGAEGRYSVHAVPLERRLPDLHTLLVTEDLSELQRLEGQLLHSEKLATAGVLSAGIAHEIGTPLNVARGRAELTLERLGPDHPAAESQRLIIDQIDHVTRLIGELLGFVRPHAAAVQPVDPAAAVRSAAALLATEAQRRGVELVADAPEGLPPVLADPGQLQQVLVNLGINALDACERGGRVRLGAARGEDGAVVVEVADDGCGIPRPIRARIFDPFFTTKKRGKGTGLGLAVVDHLVRSHGATLTIDSEVGRGTLVRVAWPATLPRSP